MFKSLKLLSPNATAVALFLLAIFCFSIMDTFAKTVSQNHHSLQVVWARYFFQVVLSFLVLAPRVVTLLRTRYIKLQLVRSLFLFGGTILFFTSLKYMHLATATAIFEVGPLLITALAVFVLKEKVGPRRWIAVAVGLMGAMIIIRPTSEAFTWVAVMPFFAAFCFAGYTISTRFLGREEPATTAFLYSALIGTVIASLFLPFVWTTPSLRDLFLMVGMGALGGFGHYIIIRALTIGEASLLAPFAYFGLILNAIWGFLFFAEVPEAYVAVGAAIIIGAGLFVWAIENRSRP